MHRLLRGAILTALLTLAIAGSAAAAAAPYDANTVIVKFRPGIAQLQQSALLQSVGAGRVVSTISGLGSQVVRVTRDPAVVAAALNRSALVEYAEPNYILKATGIPNDPRFGELYGMHNTGQAGGTADADIDAPEGWDAAFGLGAFPATGGPRVAVVDTGILASHEDLSGQVVACAKYRTTGLLFGTSRRTDGDCADDNGHGTHTAGTVAAHANNGRGVAGVAFNSPLIICKSLYGPLGTGNTADVANCITWSYDRGAKVISLSLGGGNSTTLHNAVKYAWKSGGTTGALVVAAAGNDGNSAVNYPAGYAEAISVAATDRRDQRASFSNANADVEVAAPGVDTLSTYYSSTTSYTTMSGTSMATPHASGVAAVIWGRNPGAAASTIRSKLTSAVDDLGPAGRDTSFGFGRVNLLKAATG
jgi:thermitase